MASPDELSGFLLFGRRRIVTVSGFPWMTTGFGLGRKYRDKLVGCLRVRVRPKRGVSLDLVFSIPFGETRSFPSAVNARLRATLGRVLQFRITPATFKLAF